MAPAQRGPSFNSRVTVTFHVHIEAHVYAAILQRANHLQTCAITYVAEPAKCVAAKSALQDLSILCAIEQRSPLFELSHTFGSFLGVKLSHAPVVEHLSATHGVAEMCSPVVRRIDVGHGGGDSTLRHHRVGFA